MKKEYLDSMIQSVTEQLKIYWEEQKNNNNDFNDGIIHGMYFVADTIQNWLMIQNDIEGTNKYSDFIELVEEIEKDIR